MEANRCPRRQRILVVDDVPANVQLLVAILVTHNYEVCIANSGVEALARVTVDQPDLVLLDVMMPDMDGYQVCRAIRKDYADDVLPIVLVTSLDPATERVAGLEAGADDFLSKPVQRSELIARVRSLLRIKQLYDQVRSQARQLSVWNAELERGIAEGVAKVERLSRLQRFFSPAVANLILAGKADDPAQSRRREIVAVFLDLRGFTAFSEAAGPDEVMRVVREYHAEMGRIIVAHEGTLEHFAGDGMMVVFNDPVEIANPELRAVAMAVSMRDALVVLAQSWHRRGHDLAAGIGIAQGIATIGTIGYEGRLDYSAIGSVCNLAARLSGSARGGQILVTRELYLKVGVHSSGEAIEPLMIKGFSQPVPVAEIIAMKSRDFPIPVDGDAALTKQPPAVMPAITR